MRNILRALALILLMALPTLAQTSTTVTINVTDAGSIAWASGTWKLSFVGQANSSWPGGNLTTSFSGSLNGSGSASQSTPSNATITPQPNFWNVTVCPSPAVTTNTGCFSQQFTISGSTQTLTVTPPAISISVPTIATNISPVVAYADAEISGGWVGFSYYNVTSAANRQCTTVNASGCTVWAASGGAVASVFGRTGAVVATSGDYTASQVTGGGGMPQDAFYITTACGGKTNCLQWVDDDSTDNCGSATTTFLASINAYAGPGVPQLFIEGSGIGKAYKLATASCILTFTYIKGVAVHISATIDCAQAATYCIQLGPVNTPGAAPSYPIQQLYSVDGEGAIVNGTSLTVAGIYVEPQVNVFRINHLKFFGTGANPGFGTNHAMGACTNWAVFVDFPVGSGVIDHLDILSNTASATSGACGIGNPNGVTTGSNTVMIKDNLIGTQGNIGTAQCGSLGVQDGGSYGEMSGNNMYGYGIPILLGGTGHMIIGNQLDSAGCASNGVAADIQVGFVSSSAAVGPVTIAHNVGQFYSPHATGMLGLSGSTSSTLTGFNLIGNISAPSGNNGSMFAGSPNCTPLNATFCVIYGNENLPAPTPSGSSFQGWESGGMLGEAFPTGQTANIGSTVLYTPAIGRSVLATCQVILTTAATSSTLPQCQVSYTDSFSNATVTLILSPVWASGAAGCTGSTTNTVGNSCQGGYVISPKAGTAVNYSTINYVSSPVTTMQYAILITASGIVH